MKETLPFVKMHTLGNDFMLTEGIRQPVSFSKTKIQHWADRHRGIGFDQLLCAEPPNHAQADFFMRVYNADGSEASQCGNGLRCFYTFVRACGLTSRRTLNVETLGGLAVVEGDGDGNVVAYLKSASVDWHDVLVPQRASQQKKSNRAEAVLLQLSNTSVSEDTLSAYPISVGNPHLIVLTPAGSTPAAMLTRFGASLSQHPDLLNGANVGFMQMKDTKNMILRTYERGSGGTLACGSNTCAAAVLAMEKNLAATEITVHNLGGQAQVGRKRDEIYMCSQVHWVYAGSLP